MTYAFLSIKNEDNYWTLTLPEGFSEYPLVILIGNWSYGLIPFCGPGKRSTLYEIERRLLEEVSSYLVRRGSATLRLVWNKADIPDDSWLKKNSGPGGVLKAIQSLDYEQFGGKKGIFLFGHGLGGYVACQLASLGITPGGYIFASGIYSDPEYLLSQKYLLLRQWNDSPHLKASYEIDPESLIIFHNISQLLQASRRGRKSVVLGSSNPPVEIHLIPELFAGDQIPRCLFRHIKASSLVIHGSGDMDVPVSDAFSIEQALKRNRLTLFREILSDCDHWFTVMPRSYEDRIIERISGKSLEYQIDNRFLESINSFIGKIRVGSKKVS